MVGGLRVCAALFGPVTILYAAVQLALLPEMLRVRDTAELLRLVKRATLLLSAATTVWAVVAVVLPYEVGVALFGASWSSAQPLLVPYGVYMVATALVVSPITALRSLSRARLGLQIALTQLPVVLFAPPFGVLLLGPEGAGWGLVLAGGLSTSLWWYHLYAITRTETGKT